MNTKLKCLLLDDELPGLTYLKMMCEQIPELEVVKAFNSPEIFLSEMNNYDFDLCILDIEMPTMNGLQVANLLDSKLIIFTTAYKEYAVEAFDLDAVDYVRKPVKKERLQQAVKKAMDRFQQKTPKKEFAQFNTDKGKAIVFFDQPAYIKTSEIDSRDKVVQMMDGSVLTLKNISFDKLQKILPAHSFCQINKKEMIALKTVQVFSFDEISTIIPTVSGNFLRLTLSEIYRENFLRKVQI